MPYHTDWLSTGEGFLPSATMIALPKYHQERMISFSLDIMFWLFIYLFQYFSEIKTQNFRAESQFTASHLFARTRSFHRPTFIRPGCNCLHNVKTKTCLSSFYLVIESSRKHYVVFLLGPWNKNSHNKVLSVNASILLRMFLPQHYLSLRLKLPLKYCSWNMIMESVILLKVLTGLVCDSARWTDFWTQPLKLSFAVFVRFWSVKS